MASSLFKTFATNKDSETKGTRITFGGDESFLIARMGRTNKRYQLAVEAASKEHKIAIRNETLDPAIDEAITLDVFLKTVLLDWSGVKVPEVFGVDEEVGYNYDNGKKLMLALPELYTNLREQATSVSNFRLSTD